MRAWQLLLAAAALAAPATAAEVDWPKLAELVVKRSLQLTPGERVVLYWDQTSEGIAAPAFRSAVLAAGGALAPEIRVPRPDDLEAMKRLPPDVQARQRERLEELWNQAFAGADAAIWLGVPSVPFLERPFEHLVERHTLRTIHFHWFLPPDAADVAAVEGIYARAIAVEPERLAARIDALESALRGANVRIRAANGTDLTLRVPAEAWVHHNTGDASRAKVASARSVRDREEELPASVLRTTDLTALAGTFVGHASYDTRSPILEATFAGGRLTRLASKRGAEAIVAAWEKATGDKEAAGELVISTNAELPALLPSGFMPYYGYGAGIVRLAIGDNWESGGKNRTSNGETLLFLPGSTVEAGGKTLIRDGAIVVGADAVR